MRSDRRKRQIIESFFSNIVSSVWDLTEGLVMRGPPLDGVNLVLVLISP